MNFYFPLRIVPDHSKIDFMGLRFFNMSISAIALLLSIFLVVTKGLNLGIDFKGGTIIEAKLDHRPDIAALTKHLSGLKLGEIHVSSFNDFNLMIKLGNSNNNSKNPNILKESLTNYFKGNIVFTKLDFVGPQVGMELIKNGFMAMIFSFAGIMLYIAFRFEWQYGLGIIIALIHDAVFTLGFMSLTNIEFDLTSIAAILTVIGYSVNDSVVIYDRIRENMMKYKRLSVKEIINLSVNEALGRTVLTVLTTLISIAALIFFGGDKLFSFSLTSFFGIFIGTYSSIYISAPILIHLGIKKSAA